MILLFRTHHINHIINLRNMTKKILLLSALLFCLQMNYKTRAQILFSENFSSGALPTGWTNDSLGQPAVHLWVFTNPFSRVITGAGFDSNFALFDSDENLTDDSIVELASLTTPSIDITGAASTLFLEVDEQFRSLAPPNGDAKRRIEYSINAGASWVTIVFDSVDYGYPDPAVHSTYDISSIIGGATNILVRFTYTGNWDWWWALDNMKITSYSACTAPPVAGAATSSVPDVCPDIDFDLILVGADSGPDISYQWQSSPDGVTWTNILSVTGINYTISRTTATY